MSRKKKEKKVDYKLVEKIYELVKNGSSYVEALVEICSKNEEKDMYDFAECLPDNVIEQIKLEFVERRMVKDESTQEKLDIKNRIEGILDWLE